MVMGVNDRVDHLVKEGVMLWYVSKTSTNNYLRISEKYFDPVKAYCIRSTDVLVTI